MARRSQGEAPGSSPRAWGTDHAAVLQQGDHRFIPTSVGNGSVSRARNPDVPVHPHERGERKRGCRSRRTRLGSSPRAWGTGLNLRQIRIRARFIPTSVGNGALHPEGVTDGSVHPHERGERDAQAAVTTIAAGSSPRAWGTVGKPEVQEGSGRFIPTSVGNGAATRTTSTSASVHPHERGERKRRSCLL